MPPPTVTVRVDWDNDGTFATAGDDITADVSTTDPSAVAVSISRGASADFGSGDASGRCTIVVRNDTGKYLPDNASSPLAGKLKVGRPVWITATYSAVTYGLFAGHLSGIVPDPASRMATLICDDPLARYGRLEAAVADSTTRSLKAYRTAILDAIGEHANRRDLAEESEIPGYTGEQTTSALSLLEEINASTLSRHFIRPGTAEPAWYVYTTRDRHYKLDVAASLSLGDTDPSGMDGFDLGYQTLINDQFAEPAGRAIATGETEVWAEPEVPVYVPAAGSRTVWAQFSDPVVAPRVVSVATGSPTITLTALGTSAKIVITAGGTPAKVTELAVWGRTAGRVDAASVRTEDSASITAYGRYAGNAISASLVPTTTIAAGLASHMVYRFRDPRRRPKVQFVNLWPTMLEGQPFEPMTLTWTRLALTNRRFEITGIDLDISGDRNTWTAAWQLQEPPSQSLASWVKVGGSAAEGVGGSGVLAY